jgi:hypothetical protein
MAERYRSPTKASQYAFWAHQNVQLDGSEKRELQGDIEEDLNSENNDASNSYNKPAETEAYSLIAAEEDESEEDEEVRKNVWSDTDDELYIANLIKSRTSNEVKRDIRDTSVYSDISEKVVSSDKLDNNEMWDIEPTDLTECDCLGPPPEFLLPPPPRPPFLQAEYYCGDDPIPDLETCDTEPVSEI